MYLYLFLLNKLFFFLTEPDSKGYISVLTTVPCVEGHLNEVIVSERLILKLMGMPNLSDLLNHHELMNRTYEFVSTRLGGGGSESLYETFRMLTSNPTRFNLSWSYIGYAVFLKTRTVVKESL